MIEINKQVTGLIINFQKAFKIDQVTRDLFMCISFKTIVLHGANHHKWKRFSDFLYIFQTFHRIQSLVKRQGKWNPFTFIPVGKSPNYVSIKKGDVNF